MSVSGQINALQQRAAELAVPDAIDARSWADARTAASPPSWAADIDRHEKPAPRSGSKFFSSERAVVIGITGAASSHPVLGPKPTGAGSGNGRQERRWALKRTGNRFGRLEQGLRQASPWYLWGP